MSDDKNPGPDSGSEFEDGLDKNTPNDGYDRSERSRREDGFGARYQPTEHPEDAPGGFNPSNGNSSYGTNPYPGPNAGQNSQQNAPGPQGYSGYSANSANSGFSGYPGYSGYSNSLGGADNASGSGIPMEQSDGKIDIMRAVRFGFRTVFSNPVVWIVGTLVIGIGVIVISGLLGALAFAIDPEGVMSGSSLSAGNILINVVTIIITFAVCIFAMRGALLSVDGYKPRVGDFFRPINVGQTVLLLIILGVIGAIAGFVMQSMTATMVAVDSNTGTVEVNNEQMGTYLIVLVVMLLVNPLYAYWIYYTADGREGISGAIKHGFADAARNYPKLLIFSILSAVVVAVLGVVTLLLALLVLVPAGFLINVHLYRQMSRGAIPVEQR